MCVYSALILLRNSASLGKDCPSVGKMAFFDSVCDVEQLNGSVLTDELILLKIQQTRHKYMGMVRMMKELSTL